MFGEIGVPAPDYNVNCTKAFADDDCEFNWRALVGILAGIIGGAAALTLYCRCRKSRQAAASAQGSSSLTAPLVGSDAATSAQATALSGLGTSGQANAVRQGFEPITV